MTKQEEEKIREMALAGAPCKEVANALGKHYSTIKRYLKGVSQSLCKPSN